MRFSDRKNKLLVEGHAYAAEDRRRLGKYALWVACAEEHNPYYAAHANCLTIWCPLDDCDPPRKGDLEKAHAASELVSRALYDSGDVLVTCAMGLNRSALVAGLALRNLGWKGRKIVEVIRMERGKYALSNRAFEQAVLRG